MGGTFTRFVGASQVKALVSRAGLPLEVDDDAVSAGIKDPGKVRWTSCALVMHDSLWMHHNAYDGLNGSCCIGSCPSTILPSYGFG